MLNNKSNWPNIVATAMLTNPAVVLGIVAPAIMTGLTQEAHFSLASAGRLLAIEFMAITAAILLLPLVMGRGNDRMLAAAAAVAMIIGQLSIFTGDALIAAVGRGALGFGEGALYGFAIAALARTHRPDRAFGIGVLLNLIFSAALLALSTWAHLRFPSFGILVLLLGFFVLTAFFVPSLPSSTSDRQMLEPIKLGSIIAFMPGFLGIFLFAAGFGSTWPLVSSIARAGGVSDTEIGQILSIAGVAGIFGAAISIVLAERIGRTLPLVVGSACLALALAGSATGHVQVAAPAVLFFWSFATPYYFGSAAVADPGGRLAAFSGAVIPLGIAAGQTFAGVVFKQNAPLLLAVSATGMLIGAILCMMLLRQQATAVSVQPGFTN